MEDGLTIIKSQEITIRDEILNELTNKGLGGEKIVSKLKALMDAKTLNNRGDKMDDNKAQLEALKLILKLYGMKVDPSININLFNIPKPNERLKF